MHMEFITKTKKKSWLLDINYNTIVISLQYFYTVQITVMELRPTTCGTEKKSACTV